MLTPDSHGLVCTLCCLPIATCVSSVCCCTVLLQCVLLTNVLLFRNSKTSTVFHGKAPLHGVQH